MPDEEKLINIFIENYLLSCNEITPSLLTGSLAFDASKLLKFDIFKLKVYNKHCRDCELWLI